MADSQDKEAADIKVTDRRHFTRSGERRDSPTTQGADSAKTEHREQQPTPEPTAARPVGDAPPSAGAGGGGSTIDFAGFVTSLATVAMLHLGEIADPESGERHVNLEFARHHIDLLAMLDEKTRGNLSAEEQQLLEGLLAELQLKFVKARSGR